MCRAPCPHAGSSKLRPTPPQRDIDCATIPWRIARPTPCPVHLWPTLATDRRRRDGELVSAALVCYVHTLAYFSPKKGCSRSPGAIRLLAVWSHGPVVHTFQSSSARHRRGSLASETRAVRVDGAPGPEWIALACLHSGVFTRAQLSAHLRIHRRTARRFVRAMSELRLAAEETVEGRRVCRI